MVQLFINCEISRRVNNVKDKPHETAAWISTCTCQPSNGNCLSSTVRSAVVDRQFMYLSLLGAKQLVNICLMQVEFLCLIGSRYSNIRVEIYPVKRLIALHRLQLQAHSSLFEVLFVFRVAVTVAGR